MTKNLRNEGFQYQMLSSESTCKHDITYSNRIFFCIFMCVYLYIHIFMSMYIYTYMYVTTIDGKRHHNFKIMQAGIYKGHRMRKGKEKIMWLYYKLKTWF